MNTPRDHGGGLDAAIARYGGSRDTWLDLSTGINPVPYPVDALSGDVWTALPDETAQRDLEAAARSFWSIPQNAGLVPASGASVLIAQMPSLFEGQKVSIPGPTYNEHAAAFQGQGWTMQDTGDLKVLVHPNNPDGRLWTTRDLGPVTIVDESFCDVSPEASFVEHSKDPDRVILKSFGKFWGLAGLRLGFAILHPERAEKLRMRLGPWAVSGPALQIGAQALADSTWAQTTRQRLSQDAARLDTLMSAHGTLVGGTDLFRLYDVHNAEAFQTRLAQHQIWSRIFPYSKTWLRLGLPAPDRWAQLEGAL